jgi:transcription elongation factor Elf1
VGDDYIKCPFCSTNLRMVCLKCNSRIEEGWMACALCGTPAPNTTGA